MTWFMEILKICLEGQLLVKYYVIKHLILLKIKNMMDINADLLQWFINFLDKKSTSLGDESASGGAMKNKNVSNQELAEELYKPIIKKFEKRKAYPPFTSNSDLKNETGIDTSKFAKKIDLTSLQSEVDKLDIDKLENVPTGLNSLKSKVDKLHVDKLVPAPVDLNKLSDAVKNDVVKKTE